LARQGPEIWPFLEPMSAFPAEPSETIPQRFSPALPATHYR